MQLASRQRMIKPGHTIGILGGGQLARMLALAAPRLGLKAHVFAPEADSPAFDPAAAQSIAAYRDEAALTRFAGSIAVATYEFENVPAETVEFLEKHCRVRPGRAALAASQDRLVEKDFINGLGIATAPYARVEEAGALGRAVTTLGRPAILKTRRFGYDGKGQRLVREGSDLAELFRDLGETPCVLEGLVPFSREISVVAARAEDRDFRAYDVCENLHERQMLSVTRAPARICEATAHEAVAIARRIAEALSYVGVIAVEMFVTEDDSLGQRRPRLIVNEIAPRVHNSAHWTIDGAVTSQFEQHVRAICGWPLGSTRRFGAIEMRNLIGADADAWSAILQEDGACLHLYGKEVARPGRKMGHVTRILPGPAD